MPLTAAEEVQVAKAQLEGIASSVRGKERQKQLRAWLTLLDHSEHGDKARRPLIVAEPASPASSDSDDDGEWQQLSSLPAASSRFSDDAGHELHEQPFTGPGPTTAGFRTLFLRSKAFSYLIEGTAHCACTWHLVEQTICWQHCMTGLMPSMLRITKLN